jgi:guanine nucleotide-binding protein subunit alpha
LSETAVSNLCFSFFDNVARIASPSYVPTDDDILHARVKTTGVCEVKFTVSDMTFRVVDVGGQRSERKKWIYCFEDVDTILFLVAISEYDQCLFEAPTVNRMVEAINLFESICKSKWFSRTSIILFLNKTDLFRQKLATSPMDTYFPDYTGRSYS